MRCERKRREGGEANEPATKANTLITACPHNPECGFSTRPGLGSARSSSSTAGLIPAVDDGAAVARLTGPDDDDDEVLDVADVAVVFAEAEEGVLTHIW